MALAVGRESQGEMSQPCTHFSCRQLTVKDALRPESRNGFFVGRGPRMSLVFGPRRLRCRATTLSYVDEVSYHDAAQHKKDVSQESHTAIRMACRYATGAADGHSRTDRYRLYPS